MKKKITLAVCLLLFSLQTFSQSPNWLWSINMGSTGNDIGRARTFDNAGNIYVVGSFSGTVDFDPGASTYTLSSSGNEDIFMLKLDSTGNFIWAKKMGGGGADGCGFLSLDGLGNFYIVGTFQNIVDFDPGPGTYYMTGAGMYIAKYTESGNFVWVKAIVNPGSTIPLPFGVQLDTAGTWDLYMTGLFTDTVDFDAGTGIHNLYSLGSSDVFIMRYDTSGTMVWAKSMGGNYSSEGHNLIMDPSGSGDIYTTGFFQVSCDLDPDSIGAYVLNSAGSYDVYVAKINSSGHLLWAKSMGGTGGDQGDLITLDPTGNQDIVVSGYFSATADFDPGAGTFNLVSAGSQDVFITKLDSSGNFIWAKSIGSSGIEAARDLKINPSMGNDIYVSGFFSDTADFDPGAGVFNLISSGSFDFYIAKYTGSGNFIWAKKVGGTTTDYSGWITFFPSGCLLVSSYYASPFVTLGTTVLTNASSSGTTYDFFLAKLDTAVVTSTANLENNAAGILVFPSVVTNEILIRGNESIKIKSISLFDVAGRNVFNYSLGGESNVMLDMRALASGIYLVLILDEKNNLLPKKIVKM